MNNIGLSPETYSLLLKLLRETFGHNVKIASYEVLNQHLDYFALRVDIDQPSLKLAVKLAGKAAPYQYPFDQTAMFHRLVAAQTSIPMPEILAVDVSYEQYPWRYLIKTYLPGEEWRIVKPQLTAQEQVEAYHQIGTAVAELHSIRFDSFGTINGDGHITLNTDYCSALNSHILKTVKNPDYQDMLLQLVDKHAALFQSVQDARLCHEDLHHRNILFSQNNGRWQLATILDFDKAWAGHYEIDLAKLEFWEDMVGEGWWEAYNRIMSLDNGYPERRLIYQFLWCFDYAINTPKHLADTQALCKKLGLPIINQFI
jgi:Ser/Thr protein kinase RdoA (MazF antagonist)